MTDDREARKKARESIKAAHASCEAGECPLARMAPCVCENDSKAAIDAYKAALLETGAGKWEPIETAPKDGTIVWVFEPAEETPGYQTSAFYGPEPLKWLEWNNGWGRRIEPTYWQPLPNPPAPALLALTEETK